MSNKLLILYSICFLFSYVMQTSQNVNLAQSHEIVKPKKEFFQRNISQPIPIPKKNINNSEPMYFSNRNSSPCSPSPQTISHSPTFFEKKSFPISKNSSQSTSYSPLFVGKFSPSFIEGKAPSPASLVAIAALMNTPPPTNKENDREKLTSSQK